MVNTWIKKFGFNPRSREGATRYLLLDSLVLHSFNPRSREGATKN